MWHFLGKVNRNLIVAIPVMMVTLNIKKVLEGGDTRAQVLTQLINFAVAYIVQVQSAAWYVKFTDRFFGPPDTLEGSR